MSFKPNQGFLTDVARAMEMLAQSCSDSLTADCIVHAILVREMIKERYRDARIQAGYAAWRIGSAAGAVVAHHPDVCAISDRGVVFHTWIALDMGRWIFDPTTYQLGLKMQMIDASDGGCTPYQIPHKWETGLLMPHKKTHSWPAVKNGVKSGSCCYIANREITQRVFSHPDSVVDVEDLRMLKQVYEQVVRRLPIKVIGPSGKMSQY